MKVASTQLATHIAGETTTLATCWKVTRHDGLVLGFGIALPIEALLMDLPMLRADDDGLGLYYAFGIRNNNGQNATLYRAPDALAWSVVGTGIGDPAFGWAANVLGDTAHPWTWDEDNSVQIALAQGTLDSKTALEVLNWANVALLGDEIIQWRNATLLATNLYQGLDGLQSDRTGSGNR